MIRLALRHLATRIAHLNVERPFTTRVGVFCAALLPSETSTALTVGELDPGSRISHDGALRRGRRCQ